MNAWTKQKGVTLPELMISISVLSIMMALSTPSYSEFTSKRQVAGAANLIASFFENVKFESVKRNEYASITYKIAANGIDWCIGAVMGKEVACDCLAETPVCTIDTVPTIISNETYSNFNDLVATFTDGTISYDPTRGILTDPMDAVAIQLKHTDQNFLVNISVNATGSISKCSPSGYNLVGYPTCI